MKTLEECYDIIVALNEEAHSMAWDTWIEADRLSDESEDDDGWIRAEELREQASLEQQEYFVDLFEELDEETKEELKNANPDLLNITQQVYIFKINIF